MHKSPDFSDLKTMEKFSSACTLSDMEIFVFPELFYPLVLANIMSPIIWKWRSDNWFKDIQKKSFVYKINRIKQYIMEHYLFNLDLETWGLTTKDREMQRFSSFIDIETLKQSNALFGYEGDKYYYDIDIRRHFGLDKYTTDIIPYWKTETVEAMTAFRYKEAFNNGAGECVSLSALYAAALFIVGHIDIEKIFLIATPLHSQNFININEGVLTNNRRIITKKMWFNGTSLTTKARRALEHERVTIISHISGFIHLLYPQASIDQSAYNEFSKSLRNFLKTELTAEIFINFLRYDMNFKKCFQFCYFVNEQNHYITLEKIFEYEHDSKHNFSEKSRETLLNDIDNEEFNLSPIEGRIILNEVEKYLEQNKHLSFETIREHFLDHAKATKCSNFENLTLLFEKLWEFLNVTPKLPNTDKTFHTSQSFQINNDQTREEIIKHISQLSEQNNEAALLALYTYRLLEKTSWGPFFKAALERNPVSVNGLKNHTTESAYRLIDIMPNESIYDGQRVAQPDEVWNFGRGDGIEKAILLANFLFNFLKPSIISLSVNKENVLLQCGQQKFPFHSSKNMQKEEKNILLFLNNNVS